MTTEPGRPGRARHRTSPLELRLYVAALLAALYTIAWRAIGGHAAVTESASVPPPAPAPSQPPRLVWLDSLPPGMRPAVALPAGWRLASDARPASSQPAQVVRVPGRRAPRVRTRSS